MVIAVAEVKGKFFRWNLSANVGPQQPNKLDDVELVRFGYFCMRENKQFPAKPEVRAALQEMRNSGPFAQDLANVIVAHQRSRGGTQDGRVSVANVSFTSANREKV